jgi:hypothetical protein
MSLPGWKICGGSRTKREQVVEGALPSISVRFTVVVPSLIHPILPNICFYRQTPPTGLIYRLFRVSGGRRHALIC